MMWETKKALAPQRYPRLFQIVLNPTLGQEKKVLLLLFKLSSITSALLTLSKVQPSNA